MLRRVLLRVGSRHARTFASESRTSTPPPSPQPRNRTTARHTKPPITTSTSSTTFTSNTSTNPTSNTSTESKQGNTNNNNTNNNNNQRNNIDNNAADWPAWADHMERVVFIHPYKQKWTFRITIAMFVVAACLSVWNRKQDEKIAKLRALRARHNEERKRRDTEATLAALRESGDDEIRAHLARVAATAESAAERERENAR